MMESKFETRSHRVQQFTSSQFKSNRRWLAVIIAVAVLLRLAAAFYLGDSVVKLPGTSDQISYDTLAQRVIAGYGFSFGEDWWPATRAGEPTAHWSYLYTLYLAAVYSLFGYHPLYARLIQALLAGLLIPWLIYRLGSRHFNSRVGLVAAGIAALYVYLVYYTVVLMTETFYITAILWTLDLAGQLGDEPNPDFQTQRLKMSYQWLWLGLALAITVLLRQVFLLFVPILFAWLLWRSYRYQVRSLVPMMGTLLLATVVLILSIAPWTIRNYQAFGRFVLLNTNAGFAFFWGNHPIHGYNFVSILPADGPSYQDLIPPELRGLNEAELDQALLKLGLTYIKEDPGRYLILSISRIKDYFNFWPSTDSSLISNLSRIFSFGILLPLMIYGLTYSLRRSWSTPAQILYLFVAVYTGVHLLSWALIRYRLPVDAILIVFASVALLEIMAKLTRRNPKFRKIHHPSPLHSGE